MLNWIMKSLLKTGGLYKVNGTGICNWNDWKNLSEDQKQFEIHRVLVALDNRTSDIMKSVKFYAFSGGFVGGVVTVLAIFSFKLSFNF